ncbi:hypothetical protein FB451DRAFT_1038781 [Mycena latifolia]|nr:hypothetical protein FB451DRAFT_1038781 [Mycena latifolia]
MPTRSRCQSVAHRLNHRDTSSGDDDENVPSDDLPIPENNAQRSPRTPKKTLKAQIIEKDARIAELENIVSRLATDLENLQNIHNELSLEHQALLIQMEHLSLTTGTLKTLKRKAEATLTDELTKKHKRIKRLERERDVKQHRSITALSNLNATIDHKSTHIAQLQHDLASANNHILSQDLIITSLHSNLKEKQSALSKIRTLLSASRKQTHRAQTTLKEVRKAYRNLETWDPMEAGSYSAASRELVRDLSYAGCSAGKVEHVVKSCARTFGIKIRRRFMSRRSVGRAIDEGGKYGELQLAREIMEAPVGFVESSDGTTHRGITVESRHITLLTPSYAPDADDTDQSTWKHSTRFVEVAPALDHTGQRQFEGTLEAANRIADTYSRSPLAIQEKRMMDKNDYWRKKIGECKDHAADGKKAFKISAAHKEDIIIRDMGRVAMDEADVSTSLILLTMLEITDAELQDAGRISDSEFADRSSLVEKVLEREIGEDAFNSLTPAERCNKCTHVFGGCCCHKDLNVVRYGVAEMEKVYSAHDLPPPVLLANKANHATINLSDDPNNPAVQRALESSSSGAIKLLQLIGALLRHKDGERGYQDKATIFLQERKLELFNLDEPGKFPDVSNTRYGCYTYAAAEVVCFHGIIEELVLQIIDGKTKSGQPNHVEYLILKGINCAKMMEQLIALALYGICVSWRYMAIVRGTKEKPVNLLSLTDLHRKLPVFCQHIADNPHILLDPTTPLDQLTIDGMLGSYRGHMRYHPNSTAHSFSNQTRTERNNTEAFIKKCCDAAVQRFIMREVRKDGASGSRAKFRKAWSALQREKAENALTRRRKTASRKKATASRLAATPLELDISKIRSLSSKMLKEQLHVYKDVLKDEILSLMLWKDMGLVEVRRNLVLEARERELARR